MFSKPRLFLRKKITINTKTVDQLIKIYPDLAHSLEEQLNVKSAGKRK